MVGRTLNHYEVVESLGAGGMGEVYRAHDTVLRRDVAIKVLHPEMAASKERLERFQREARALAALDHPNIVHIYSVECAEDVHFLSMQLIRGKCLSELIQRGGMSSELFFETAVPLADALRAAHERGITHRDLKPGNVMADAEGRIKILDFGLAKLLLPEAEPGASHLPTELMTQEGLVLGTVPYMSPEQAQGRQVDHRTDIFSLGVMLHEMATGLRPFRGDSSAGVISSILRDKPVSVTAVRSDLPEHLGRVIRRCLEKSLGRRFQSALEVRNELEDLQQEAAFVRAAASKGEESEQAATPAPQLAETQAPRVSSLAVLPLKNLLGDPEQEYFVDALTEALITDLSKIGSLKVISRSSSMRFKGTDKSVAEIADELGVEAVVEGSVLKAGDRVGISAQLVEAETDRNVWADRYERDATSVFALQAEVAQAIAHEIHVTLTPAEETLLAGSHDVEPAAFEAYLKGRFHRDKFTPGDLDTAQQYFETALEIDPEYALAHFGTGSVWNYRMVLGVATPREAAPVAKEAISRAIALDDSIAEAHLGLANLEFSWEWDWERAEREFLRAIELNPNYAEAHVFYSHFLVAQRRPKEADHHIQRALELDPLEAFFQAMYGVVLMVTGRFEEAVSRFESSLEAAPGLGFARQPYWRVLHRMGRDEEAFEQAKAHFSSIGEDNAVKALDRGWEAEGYKGAMGLAAEVLAAGSRTALARPMNIVALYDDAGRIERALPWLQKALEARDIDLPYLSVELYSAELRGHQHFQEVLRQLDLPG